MSMPHFRLIFPCLVALATAGCGGSTSHESRVAAIERIDADAVAKTLSIPTESPEANQPDDAPESPVRNRKIVYTSDVELVVEDLDQLKGRLRVMADLVDLATINLKINEQQTYQPPRSPTYFNRVADTFTTSAAAIATLLKNLGLLAVALLPWLLLTTPVLWLAWRRYR